MTDVTVTKVCPAFPNGITLTHHQKDPGNKEPHIYFTGDLHFGHANVIEYSKRPFSSVEEMDEALVKGWNDTVRPGDLVYVLGDIALCRPEKAIRLVQRLQGQKYLIFGNHDKVLRKNKEFLAEWIWARDQHQIQVGDQKIMLNHYAMRTWASSHYGAWQLYGHSHGSLPDLPTMKSTDVGVDRWDYKPVSFETLKVLLDARTFVPVDHHE